MSSQAPRNTFDQPNAMADELRRLSAYTVLFNEAVAERLGITLTELKCSSLLDLHGAMTAGALADLTGLTTGAITGVIDRLERAKLARRVADPHDRRRVIVEPVRERAGEFDRLYAGLGAAMGALLSQLEPTQLATVRDFIVRTNAVLLAESKALRGASRARALAMGS
ncbi:MAG: MarR family transcriptional regulator, partial [Deltaproteobacteria bacterium]|nr:MarR family transcriptional regulator [Nannocystaceae bacterium]